jgi:hypothetical protein
MQDRMSETARQPGSAGSPPLSRIAEGASRRELWAAAGASALFAALLFAWLAAGPLLIPNEGRQAKLAATSLLEGRGFEVRAGTPFANYGPLYPALLAALQAAGLGVIEAVYLVHCATLALTIFALYLLCRRMGLGAGGSAGAAAFFALSPPAHYLLRAARPDPIPIACSIFAIAAALAYAREASRRALSGMALACALAASARYMALFTLLPVMGLAVLWLAPPARRLADALRFATLAAAPSALWLARNAWIAGHPLGMSRTAERRNALDLDLAENALALLRTVGIDLFSPEALGVRRVLHGEIPLDHPRLVAVSAIAFLTLAAAVALLARRGLGSGLDPRARTGAGLGLLLLALFELEYSLALVVLWTLGNNDPIHTRFAAPLYAPAVAIGFALAARAWRARPSRLAALALASALLLLAVPSALRTLRLLGPDPGPKLLEVTGRTGRLFWQQRAEWRE